jgi:hypothetical protein
MVGLYINNQLIDFSDDIVPRITKKSWDINNPNQIWSDYTKSINIPSTSESDLLFGFLFNVNIDIQNVTDTNFTPDFNPNLKAPARIDVNDETYIDGYAQLTNIVTGDFKIRTYVITIYGTIYNLFNRIGNQKLTDLDFSPLDHTWNETNVVASWTPTLGSGYVYPMIDYGLSPSFDLWNVTQFLPAIFVKEYIDKIFNASGYSYTSTFLTSDIFKRLIIPYTGDGIKLTEAVIADRIFYVERISTAQTGSITTTPATVSSYDTVIFQDDATGINFNTLGTDYNTGTGVWSVGVNSRYSFRGSLTINITRTNSTFFAADDANGNNVAFNLAIVKFDGANYSILETIRTEWNGYTAGYVAPTEISLNNTFSFSTNEHQLEVGEDVYLAVMSTEYFGALTQKYFYSNDFDYSIATGALFTININPSIAVGDSMPMNQTLPQDVTQKDFLSSIFKCFNLFVDLDSENPTNLIIEPYNDFFTGSDDLTAQLDTSKDFDITPMAMLMGKRYEFTYKEDKDYINQKYEQSFDEVFGAQNKDIQNDFLIDTYKINPIFSPTPSTNQKSNDRILPSLVFTDQNGVIKSGQANIRLLYWGGLKATSKSWQLYQTLPAASTKTTYPYCGHLDDPYTPTLDLSFGVPKGIYYGVTFGSTLGQYYTNNNLYNAYWANYITETTDKNSKVITCYLDLREKYRTLSFQKTYYIKDAFYILLEVLDHAVIGDETTKCRFLKVNSSAAFTPTSGVWRGGTKLFPTDEKFPNIQVDTFKGGGGVQAGNGTTLGNGNTGGGGVLVGDDNKSAFIFKNVNNFGGDDNKIAADKITMIGTNDYYEWREGATIINNLWTWTKVVVTLTGTEAAALTTTPVQILPECDPTEYYEIDRMYAVLTYLEAFTSNATLTLETDTTFSDWATITTGLFNASADAQLMGTIAGHPLNFGEGLRLTSSIDAGAGATNTVKVIIYYRINRL